MAGLAVSVGEVMPVASVGAETPVGQVRVCDKADDTIENKDTINNIVDVVRTVVGAGIMISA